MKRLLISPIVIVFLASCGSGSGRSGTASSINISGGGHSAAEQGEVGYLATCGEMSSAAVGQDADDDNFWYGCGLVKTSDKKAATDVEIAAIILGFTDGSRATPPVIKVAGPTPYTYAVQLKTTLRARLNKAQVRAPAVDAGEVISFQP